MCPSLNQKSRGFFLQLLRKAKYPPHFLKYDHYRWKESQETIKAIRLLILLSNDGITQRESRPCQTQNQTKESNLPTLNQNQAKASLHPRRRNLTHLQKLLSDPSSPNQYVAWSYHVETRQYNSKPVRPYFNEQDYVTLPDHIQSHIMDLYPPFP
eukprot:TRINITY_DN3368_c0_g1_i3.p1 TRINITY_DN3368_c0_g1~~TRINITY_DN3368_c0_g1_i3.p1  ORF type:complete len:155 (+),score=1.75 TRINITY_DN3368_c0_g1_i3:221-685(+)